MVGREREREGARASESEREKEKKNEEKRDTIFMTAVLPHAQPFRKPGHGASRVNREMLPV